MTIETTESKTIYDLFSEFVIESAKKYEYYLEWNKEQEKPQWTLYWDYRESLSMESMKKAIKKYKTNPEDYNHNFELAVEEYLWEEFVPDLLQNFYDGQVNCVDAFLEQHPNADDGLSEEDADLLEEDLRQQFEEEVLIDLDIPQILKLTKPEDLVLYFGTNWDDDYHSLDPWTEDEEDRDYAECDKTLLGRLCKTQGYTAKDIFENKESIFCKSVHEELFDYYNPYYLNGMQLIAIPSSDDWNAIANIGIKPVILKAGSKLGFFDRINGSGCGLDITLEKDLVIDTNVPIYEVAIEYVNRYYDYSPDAVYGGIIREGSDQLEMEC